MSLLLLFRRLRDKNTHGNSSPYRLQFVTDHSLMFTDVSGNNPIYITSNTGESRLGISFAVLLFSFGDAKSYAINPKSSRLELKAIPYSDCTESLSIAFGENVLVRVRGRGTVYFR